MELSSNSPYYVVLQRKNSIDNPKFAKPHKMNVQLQIAQHYERAPKRPNSQGNK